MPQPREPILIWGAGAIGGVLGAYWARAGLPVQMVDIVAEHATACSTHGMQIATWRVRGANRQPARSPAHHARICQCQCQLHCSALRCTPYVWVPISGAYAEC